MKAIDNKVVRLEGSVSEAKELRNALNCAAKKFDANSHVCGVLMRAYTQLNCAIDDVEDFSEYEGGYVL